MVWIGSTGCENFRHDCVAQTSALIAPFWRILHRVLCSSETVTNASKRKETHQNMSLRSTGVDQERSLQTFSHDVVILTFALIAIVWRVLHRVSSSREMVPNAPKQNKMHEDMSLGSSVVDQECWLRKIMTRLCDTNFCINCNSLAHFASSFV